MPKGKNSWSIPDIPGIIARKKVDWSIFEYGFHIPQELHKNFEKANGNVHLEQGQSHDLILIIDDKNFKASFFNINQKNKAKDTLQIRYDSNKELKKYLQERLSRSFNYIAEKKTEVPENKKINIIVPDSLAEYIDFCESGEPYKYIMIIHNSAEVNIPEEPVSQDSSMTKIWWVNQGTTLKKAVQEGCLWAPIRAKNNAAIYHWETMKELKRGDIILHYADNAIRYVSRVIEESIEAPKPEIMEGSDWEEQGRLVKVEYNILSPIIKLEKFSHNLLRHNIEQGPLTSTGGVKQGYLFRFDVEGLNIIQTAQPDTVWPSFAYFVKKQLLESKTDKENSNKVNFSIFDILSNISKSVKINPKYELDQCSQETGIGIDQLTKWVRAIERKGQAIIYGPPGTGKTYTAEHIAQHLISEKFGFIDIIQFHPAYSYEDFIQGIRPEVVNNILTYPTKSGRFLEFCEKAKDIEGVCVLIIDEINRANLSRVFGELMFLLEYRDKEIPLAGGGTFSIPQNVRIIGTMNTADRSIALVDHALRRRFAFLQLRPNFEVLAKYHDGNSFPIGKLVGILQLINKNIGDEHYQIGISYFMRKDLDIQLEDIWQMEIEPYLDEYFFDQPNRVSEFRWDKVKEKLF